MISSTFVLSDGSVTTTKIVDGAITNSKLGTNLAIGNAITIPCNCWTSSNGTWVIANTDGIGYNMNSNNSNTNLEWVQYPVWLSVGTYKFEIMGMKGNNMAIIDIDIDGVEVMSFDCYFAGAQTFMQYSQSGISIATSGLKNIRIRVDGKNGASSSYFAGWSALTMVRTA